MGSHGKYKKKRKFDKKLDKIAKGAMEAILQANPEIDPVQLATRCYDIGEAMMKEREDRVEKFQAVQEKLEVDEKARLEAEAKAAAEATPSVPNEAQHDGEVIVKKTSSPD